MLTLTVGDGKTYSSLQNAYAAMPNPRTEHVRIELYKTTGDSLEYVTTSNVIAPDNSNDTDYTTHVIGMEGIVQGGNQIKLSFSGAATIGISMTLTSYEYGHIFENIDFESAVGGIFTFHLTAYPVVKNCRMKTVSGTVISYRYGLTVFNCILDTSNGACIYPIAPTAPVVYNSILRSYNSIIDGTRTGGYFENCTIVTTANWVMYYPGGSTCKRCVFVGPTEFSQNTIPNYVQQLQYYIDCCFDIATGFYDDPETITIEDYFTKWPMQTEGSFVADAKLKKTGDILEYCTPLDDSPLLAKNRTVPANPLYAGKLLQPEDIGAYSDYIEISPDDIIDEAGGNFVVSTLTNAKILLNTAWGLTGLGSRVDAPEASVADGILYGPDGTGLEGSLVIDYASGNDLRLGVSQNSGAIVGNLVLPTADEIKLGVASDSNGSVIGTYDPTETPDAAILVSLTPGDGSFTATFTAGLTDTVFIRYADLGGVWIDDPQTITGSGGITVTAENRTTYNVTAIVNNGGCDAPPSNMISVTPRSASYLVAGNTNWPRWIFASISRHFNNRKGDLELFIEGQYRNVHPPKDFLELRIDGPKITEINKNYYNLYLEVNILIQSSMDDTNYHRILEDAGLVAAMFTSIDLYKLGSGGEDTQEHFGCLSLLQNTQSRDSVQINQFGQIDPKTRLMQATVEGHYEISLKGD